MASMTVKHDFRVVINGREYVFTQRTSAIPTVSLSNISDVEHAIIAAATITVYSKAATAPISPEFVRFLYIQGDQDVDVELTTNDGGSENLASVRVIADLPFVLWASDAYDGTYTGGSVYTGALDVIDLIRVKNLSATAVANVRVAYGN